jgi:hypothetical protein
MLADEVQVENSDLLAKKNKSKLTVRLDLCLDGCSASDPLRWFSPN